MFGEFLSGIGFKNLNSTSAVVVETPGSPPRFYPGWTTSTKNAVCLFDRFYDDSWMYIFDSIQSCCSAIFSYDLDKCMVGAVVPFAPDTFVGVSGMPVAKTQRDTGNDKFEGSVVMNTNTKELVLSAIQGLFLNNVLTMQLSQDFYSKEFVGTLQDDISLRAACPRSAYIPSHTLYQYIPDESPCPVENQTVDVNFFYPEWNIETPKCLNDQHSPLLDNRVEEYLFECKEECCEAFFDYDFWGCLDADTNFVAPPYWYPEWNENDSDSCSFGSSYPVWMEGKVNDNLYDTQLECCKHFFWFDLENCITITTNDSGEILTTDEKGLVDTDSIHWYPVFLKSSTCKNDSLEPFYMEENPTLWMTRDKKSCCETFFPYEIAVCMSNR